MSMRHGNHQNSRLLDAIHDAEWVSTQQVVARAAIVRRPCLWILRDRGDRRIYFVGEPGGSSSAPCGVPPCSGFGLFDRLVEVLNRGAHVRRRRGSGGELSTTAPSS